MAQSKARALPTAMAPVHASIPRSKSITIVFRTLNLSTALFFLIFVSFYHLQSKQQAATSKVEGQLSH